MASGIPGNLEVQGRIPLDNKYIIQLAANVAQGLVFDGLQRFSLDDQRLRIRKSGIWREIPIFIPITLNQYGTHPAFATQQELDIYLLGGSITPPPTPTLSSIAITGPNSVSEGSSAAYAVVGTYSDSTTQTISSGITWSSNAPSGVVTIPNNSTVGDSTTLAITASYSGKSTNKTISVLDTTTPPTPTTYTATKSYTASCDTSTGHYGSSVTRSSTKTSTISQTDADNLALTQATNDANGALVCTTFNQTYNPGDNVSTINWNASPGTLLLVNLPLSTNPDPNPATMVVLAPDGVTQIGQADYNGADTGITIGIKYNGVVQIKTLTNGNITLS